MSDVPRRKLYAYSSCLWSGTQLRDFIKGYLGPKMQELGVQIYMGTFTNSDDSLLAPTLNDKDARKTLVKIPESLTIKGNKFKVTSIGTKAFYNNKKLKKVVIGNGVSKVGASVQVRVYRK